MGKTKAQAEKGKSALEAELADLTNELKSVSSNKQEAERKRKQLESHAGELNAKPAPTGCPKSSGRWSQWGLSCKRLRPGPDRQASQQMDWKANLPRSPLISRMKLGRSLLSIQLRAVENEK